MTVIELLQSLYLLTGTARHDRKILVLLLIGGGGLRFSPKSHACLMPGQSQLGDNYLQNISC